MPASRLIDILFCLLILSSLVLVRNFEALRVALVAFLTCSVCSVMLSCAANAVAKVCIIMTSCCPDRLKFVSQTPFYPFLGFGSPLLVLAQEMSVLVQKPFSLFLL